VERGVFSQRLPLVLNLSFSRVASADERLTAWLLSSLTTGGQSNILLRLACLCVHLSARMSRKPFTSKLHEILCTC